MTRARQTSLAFVLCGFLATSSAHAAGNWDWTLGLYLWGSNVSIDMAVNGDPTLGVEVGFSDLLDKVELASSFHLEGLRGKWGLMTDLTYVDLGDSSEIPLPGPYGQSVTATMDMQLVIFEAAAVYSPSASSEGFALFGGVRVMDIDQTLAFALPLPDEPSVELGISGTMVDAMLGAHYNGKLSERWGLLLRGDVATGDSEITWNAMGVLKVAFGQTGKYSAFLGYRHMVIEFEESDGGTVTNTDMTMSGPIGAFIISF